MTTTWPRAPASPTRYVASPLDGRVRTAGSLAGESYEPWVAGYDPETGAAKGRLRTDANGAAVRGGRGQRTQDLVPGRRAAPGHRRRPTTRRRTGAAEQIIGWVAEHVTTRVGPRGRQVQVPVDRIEAVVVRHYTSRAGDPHRHLHLQINARVFAAGDWRGLHTVGVARQPRRDQRHRPRRRHHRPRLPGRARRTRVHPGPGHGRDGRARAATWAVQCARRADRPQPRPLRGRVAGGEPRRRSPGRGLRRAWDRRAWAQARPDKVVPTDGAALVGTVERGAARPRLPRPAPGRTPASWPAPRGSGRSTATQAVEVVLSRLGGAAVGMERRRHPRRGRAADRRHRPRGRRRGPDRARRRPHRPRRSRRACRCSTAPTCPSTSAP